MLQRGGIEHQNYYSGNANLLKVLMICLMTSSQQAIFLKAYIILKEASSSYAYSGCKYSRFRLYLPDDKPETFDFFG